MALAPDWARSDSLLFFCDRSVDFACRFCCHKKVSITYRGSTYENSWETRLYCTVARIQRGDVRGLLQPTATPGTAATA